MYTDFVRFSRVGATKPSVSTFVALWLQLVTGAAEVEGHYPVLPNRPVVFMCTADHVRASYHWQKGQKV